MDFSRALDLLKLGKKISRTDWNGKGMYLALQTPDEHSANNLPYIYIVIPRTKGDDQTLNSPTYRVPWVASQTDLLSYHWEVVE